METESLNSLATKLLGVIWPWKSGPGASVYQLLTGPSMNSLSGRYSGTQSKQVNLSLIAQPDYLANIVNRSLSSMKFLYGKKLPLDVKVSTQSLAQSLRYGLVKTDHSIQMRGETRYSNEFLDRVRATIAADQREPRLDSPQVMSQYPENWLTARSGALVTTGNIPSESIKPLTALGITGLLLGIIAALFLLSKRVPGQSEVNPLQTAVDHLEKRGLRESQLVSRNSVEGGEKFYFQTPTENYTVIVDKEGRVFSWSRAPLDRGGEAM